MSTAVFDPHPLPLSVADNRLRMLSSVLAEIVGMSVPPLLLAVARGLAVFRIARPFATVIFTAPLPLAIRSAAHFLLGTIDGRCKPTLAMRTATRCAQPENSSGTQDEIGKGRNEAVLRIGHSRFRATGVCMDSLLGPG